MATRSPGAKAVNGKRVKTRNAIRFVPLHPVIIDLGFLDYVDA